MSHPHPSEPRTTLAAVLASFRRALAGIALMSGVVNVLALTGSFFMLQVYDRVIPGRSVPTLVGLVVFAGTLFVFQGALELIRSRLLVRIGMALDARLSGQVYAALMRLPLRTKLAGDGLQSLRDLDQVRSFMSSAGPTALFDLPWMPLYLAICFLFHFWIGMTALAGVVILFSLTLLAEIRTRAPARKANSQAAARNTLAEATRRNVEVLQAMGFGSRIAERWSGINADYLDTNATASDLAGTLGTISKILRMMLQSGILAIGAYLVIHQEATGGIMIASSIMMSRALAPIELAIAHWRGFVTARQAWARLTQLLVLLPETAISVSLPAPRSALSVESISVTPPGERRMVVQDATFALEKGVGLGIVGPSASGKSSLVRAIAGIWLPVRGTVRLDGATLDQWSPEELGNHVGYLPQDVQLFDGTIAENISRFEPQAPSDKILAAARAAGVHDLVIHLPEGYETRIGEAGSALSAGQKQRVALARALYGDPFLVILDEPNSNLDAEGEAALTEAIQGVRARGGIAIVVAHRPSALASLDQVLVMANGRIQAFGPKNEILNKITRPAGVPLKVVSGLEETAS
ncbi:MULTISPECIES: type I secretion system permease/ATPase [unclassified Mesorhizobium]|uniref:type I secretion system permease/ATPase n=1 Tax=unclassified Mesorhizobium TaxID=325217 RepID=UPI000FEA548A|nr:MULTISPECIES: type I secretion system permease/ATPase [unclassified Mesorhizobium]RWC24665.1 MAG: type I secretion system permease/ATPase [Mesorhizobium sp.]RWD38839.1 MAG: type I secretion system permease/ATPase [Mesorhizobium sp.]RWD84709.1 MAG: type I secretion system permease/ATPase [Mesorhizobium sp.]RWF53876.1 MAG: type I secretion system permease/ATPase [Mesorhizobium sp.]TGT95786.1 type I secretion system permease/ATPase [Mesorhizobium sp. M5C.F.Ca.ET.164.01.1.1]